MGLSKKHRAMVALIYSLYFFAPTISAISPAIAEIGNAYPSVSTAAIGYVVTITAILQAITALLAGVVAGRMRSLKPLVLFASLLYAASGCFPFLLASGQGFAALIVSRAFFGVATGIIMPLSNSLVMLTFDDESQRAGVVGVGNVMLSVGTIVTSLIGGYLCLVSWQTTFLVYALGLAILFLAFPAFKQAASLQSEEKGQPLPSGDQNEEETRQHGTKETPPSAQRRIPPKAFGYIGLFLLVIIATQPMVVYNANYIANAGIGDSVTAGYATAAFSLGGCLASLAFKRILKLLDTWTMPFSFAVAALSAILGYLGSTPGAGNLACYAIGIFLAGVALLVATCFTPIVIASVVPPRLLTTAMGLVSFATAAGTFLTTPIAQIASLASATDGTRETLIIAAACAVIATAATAIAVSRKNRIASKRK